MSTKLDGLIEEYDRIDGSEISHLKEELEEVRDEQDARIAELTAEVERYKDALHRVDQRCIDERNGSAFDAMYGMQEIARNALKEGV